MARNHKFYFDKNGSPKARGPASEKPLMTFLEVDVQGSDHICRELMDDLTAVEDESADNREFNGNAHCVTMTIDGVTISSLFENDTPDSTPNSTNGTTGEQEPRQQSPSEPSALPFQVPLKQFREVLEDWEAFILDEQFDDPAIDDDYL